jgi:Bacterial Ig domain
MNAPLLKRTNLQRLLCIIVLVVFATSAPTTRFVSAASDVLVRDDDPGYTERGGDSAGFTQVTGSIVSNGKATFTYSNSFSQPDNYLKWKPSIPQCGRWEVYTFMPSVNNNVPDTNHAVYQIRHRNGSQEAGGLDAIVVDQGSYDHPGITPDMRWHSLGTYTFSANAAAIGEYVLLGDNTGEGTIGSNQRSVNFDDVKWVYRGDDAIACGGGSAIPDITVADIADANAERGGTLSSLYDAPVGSVTAGGHATWTGSNVDSPDNYVKWKPPLPVCGQWEVFAFIPWVNNQMSDTSHAVYHIRHRAQTTPAGVEEPRFIDMDAVNQSFSSTQPDRWLSLGTYTFSASAGAAGEYVLLGDTTGEGGPNQRSVNFDDMRWVYRGPNDVSCQQIIDTTLPDGALITPADGATIGPSSVRLTATASDNLGVNRVEFYAKYDDVWHQIGTSYTSPYQAFWSIPFNLASQPVILTIHVIDNAGNEVIDPGGYHYIQYVAPTVDASVVREARGDLGMPYQIYRGCPTPDGRKDPEGRNNYGAGCGEQYHGFKFGVCTDLIMDAYNAGLGFNIDDQIRKDAANPLHWFRYRYRSARNSEDMRRYFQYNQQLLDHSAAYQLGDIAFFDWGHDGIADHVFIVTAINTNGRPTEVVDNPFEYQGRRVNTLVHPWNSGYDAVSMGHGRLSNSSTATADVTIQDTSGRMLVVEIDSPQVQIRLHDEYGRIRGAAYNEELVASNVQEFIPYIPGSTYESLSDRVVLRVMDPLSNSAQYSLETSTTTAGTYHLMMRVVQQGNTISSREQTLDLSPGTAQAMNISLADVNGSLTLTLDPPHPAAWLSSVPSVVDFQGSTDTAAMTSLNLTELSGQVAADVVDMRVSDLVSPSGHRIAAVSTSALPTAAIIPAGGSQAIRLRVDLTSVVSDIYRGGLIVTLNDGTRQLIPLQIDVSDEAQFRIYMPFVRR